MDLRNWAVALFRTNSKCKGSGPRAHATCNMVKPGEIRSEIGVQGLEIAAQQRDSAWELEISVPVCSMLESLVSIT